MTVEVVVTWPVDGGWFWAEATTLSTGLATESYSTCDEADGTAGEAVLVHDADSMTLTGMTTEPLWVVSIVCCTVEVVDPPLPGINDSM